MLTAIIDAMTAHLGPDYDPHDGEDFATLRRHLDNLERATADRLPPVTAADLKDDRETRRACEEWRDRRYSCVDVTDLKEDEDGDTWTILRGSSRYDVREMPRYAIRALVNEWSNYQPGRLYEVIDHETGEEYDARVDATHLGIWIFPDEESGEDMDRPDYDGSAWTRGDADQIVEYLNSGADPVWIVWDTNEDKRAEEGEHVPSYDPADEDDARDAAQQGNVEDHRENGYGWPFAHNYAFQIAAREAGDFDAAGFIVATHEPSGEVYAGIDGGGYSFLDQHWMPLYLAHLTSRYGPDYVRTDKGLRKLAR